MNEKIVDISNAEPLILHHFSIELLKKAKKPSLNEEDLRRIEYKVYTSQEMKFHYYAEWFANLIWMISCLLFQFFIIILALELLTFQHLPESLFDNTQKVFWSVMIFLLIVFIITSGLEACAWKRVMKLWEKLEQS